MKNRNILTAVVAAVFLGLLIAMIVQLFPLIRDVAMNAQDESSILEYVDSFGWRAAPALIGLAALQVIIPIIPAPAVGVLTGLSYGVYWGMLIYLAGIVIGNLFVVISVRQLHGLIALKRKSGSQQKKSGSKEKLEKIKKPEVVAFFLFLIPFLSGVGPYLFAETRVSLSKYIIAVVAGSIPSAVIYVFLGNRISSEDHTAAIITAALFLIVMLFILVFRKKIMGKIMGEDNT